MAGICCGVLGFLGVAYAQTIQFVNPVDPVPGDLVAIVGHGFGDQPGLRVVSLSRDPERDHNFSGASPACNLPIVDWTENRIRVLATCEAREYSLAIRRADSSGGRLSNSVAITIRSGENAPPAVQGGKPHLLRVHPELVEPDRVLDVYGDFPFPDPATDRIAVMKSLRGAAARVPPQVVETLVPFDMMRPHLRVRLPRTIESGEYFLVLVKSPTDRSNPLRLIVRSTEPAEWEHASAHPGSSAVDFRLTNAVQNVGLERLQLDLLGLNLGSQPRGSVHWMTASELDGVTWNLRHKDDSEARLHPVAPIPVNVVSWSDTRIRLEYLDRAEWPPGVFFLVISTPDGRWSNAVRVTVRD
jgi:hypothetical protein